MRTTSVADLHVSGAVHVWRGETGDRLDPADLALLSGHERARAHRRAAPGDARYVGTHAALRRILAGYLRVPPAQIVLGRRPCPRCATAGPPDPGHGAPWVRRPSTTLEFNLSGSGRHWLLAVAAGHPVGVDLEQVRELDVDAAAALVLSAGELAELRRLPDRADRLARFFRCWTRKEAVVKASGVGLAADLRTVPVRPATAGPVLVPHAEPAGPSRWTVQDLPAGPDRYAALARPAGCAGPVVHHHYRRPADAVPAPPGPAGAPRSAGPATEGSLSP